VVKTGLGGEGSRRRGTGGKREQMGESNYEPSKHCTPHQKALRQNYTFSYLKSERDNCNRHKKEDKRNIN
jgi:hypothetical protein